MPDGPMLGRYRLGRVVGVGSFATVFLGRDEDLERDVAIKVLADNWSRDPDMHRRFLTEARVLLEASSPRIIRGFELGETDQGTPYLVMTWADRGSLAERIDERERMGEPFDPFEAVAITREIAQALVDVHEMRHLHRDVKPSNVLIRSGGGGGPPVPGLEPDESIVLGDFGLVRGLDASAITLASGSPAYAAPEQASGRLALDARADVYALGPILLEMLTFDPGGEATTMAAAARHEVDVRGLLADHAVAVDPSLVEAIETLTASDRELRPASAAAAVALLDSLRFDRPGPAIRRNRAVPARSGRRRRLWYLAAGMAAAITGAAFAIPALTSPDLVPAISLAQPPFTDSDIDTLLPPGSLQDERRSDDQRIVATVLGEVSEIAGFYREPPEPWTVVSGPTPSGDEVSFEIRNGSRRVAVTVSPEAETASSNVSRIEITMA